MCISNLPVSDKPVRHNLETLSCVILIGSSNPAVFKERFQKIADSIDSNIDCEVKIVSRNGANFLVSFSTEMGGSPHAAIGEFFKQMGAV